MKTKALLIFLLAFLGTIFYSCVVSKKYRAEVTSGIIVTYHVQRDTLDHVQFMSPEIPITLKPTVKSQGIETNKGALVIKNEDEVIPANSFGRFISIVDTSKWTIKDTVRISFSNGKSILFKLDTDGKYYLYSKDGLVKYGDLEYKIDNFNPTKGIDHKYKLFYIHYILNSIKKAEGLKIK